VTLWNKSFRSALRRTEDFVPLNCADMTAPETPMPHPALSGRRAEAARNDERILASARAVFVADPGAPITAVAKHAGVGISALYTRYGSKEELLRRLCADGLARFVSETEAALADEREPWTAFADYMRRLVDADTSSLTLALAGKFTPTEDMFVLAERANELLREMFARVRAVLRPDVEVHDLSLIFELVAAVKTGERERSLELRRRYLAAILDGLRAPNPEPLPGPAPTWQELSERWSA
jgi:AcrR family transcriptional regulator